MVMMRAIRDTKYGTRRLMAGDEFEATPRDARIYQAIKHAEELPVETTPPRPRGRPPKARQEADELEPPIQAQAASEPGDDLDEMMRSDLLAMAEQRGIELPPGYVTKDELIRLLRES